MEEVVHYPKKNSPVVDYKNIKLLKRYTSDTGKILPSRITSVSQFKQRELSTAIKRVENIGANLMEIILLEKIRNLGDVGQVVNVKDGYGRNFLIKFGKALRADKKYRIC